jgi:2-aminoadipate transaminase
VVRTGTFSKILAAGLRLGWAISTPPILAQLSAFKDDGGTSPFSSYVVAAYMLAGALGPHITDLVTLYRQKRDVMLRALERYFPAEARWTRPAGGFFVWITLPAHLDAAEVLPRAREEGVDFLPGDNCFPAPGTARNTIRMSFSLPSPDQLDEGIKRLGQVLKTMM